MILEYKETYKECVSNLGRLYVQHTTNNNAVLEKGYTAFNKCVDAFCVSIIALIALAIISNFLGL